MKRVGRYTDRCGLAIDGSLSGSVGRRCIANAACFATLGTDTTTLDLLDDLIGAATSNITMERV